MHVLLILVFRTDHLFYGHYYTKGSLGTIKLAYLARAQPI
jgi:hypothetical protein